jgi:small subunit ribosomal protein S20
MIITAPFAVPSPACGEGREGASGESYRGMAPSLTLPASGGGDVCWQVLTLTPLRHPAISSAIPAAISPPLLFCAGGNVALFAVKNCKSTDGSMANTKSAKKATRKIARRTEVNKARRTRMRSSLRNVEDAIANGNKAAAQAALVAAEPSLMRAARTGIIHKKSASRKVSRLTHRISKLGN